MNRISRRKNKENPGTQVSSNELKKGRGRPRKNEEKATTSVSSERLILDSYFKLARINGAGNVNLQMVAQEAGVAFGTVRYHFSGSGLSGSGHDLVQSALLDLIQRAYRFLEERIFVERGKPDFNPLLAYMNAMFDWVGENRDDGSLLVYYYYLCTTKAAVAIPNTVFVERGRLRVEALLHEAIGRKIYRDVENAKDAALEIHSVVTGTCLIAATIGTREGIEIQRQLCAQMIAKLLA